MRISHYKKILFLIIATYTHLNARSDPLADITAKLLAAINSLDSISSGTIAASIEQTIMTNFEIVSSILPAFDEVSSVIEPLSDLEIATLCSHISSENTTNGINATTSSATDLASQLADIENSLNTLKILAQNPAVDSLTHAQLPATLLVMGTFLAHITYNTTINTTIRRNNCAKNVIRLINLLDFITSNWNIPAASLGTAQSNVHASLKNNNNTSALTWFVTGTSGNWTYRSGKATVVWLQSITKLVLDYCATIISIKSLTSLATPRSRNFGITADQTGRLFFCTAGGNKIYRINNDQSFTEFDTTHITIDAICTPDNTIWFTQYGNRIGKITNDGTLTQYTPTTDAGNTGSYQGITIGPDNNLWFCDPGYHRIGQITQSGTSTIYSLSSDKEPRYITTGSDGNLWFTAAKDQTINVMNTNGQLIASYPALGNPNGICLGPDGNVWYPCTEQNTINKITPSGVVTQYTLPASVAPLIIKPGWDGNLWFTGKSSITLGRITPHGIITLFTQPHLESYGITQGPDNKLWISGLSVARIDSLQI